MGKFMENVSKITKNGQNHKQKKRAKKGRVSQNAYLSGHDRFKTGNFSTLH